MIGGHLRVTSGPPVLRAGKRVSPSPPRSRGAARSQPRGGLRAGGGRLHSREATRGRWPGPATAPMGSLGGGQSPDEGRGRGLIQPFHPPRADSWSSRRRGPATTHPQGQSQQRRDGHLPAGPSPPLGHPPSAALPAHPGQNRSPATPTAPPPDRLLRGWGGGGGEMPP